MVLAAVLLLRPEGAAKLAELDAADWAQVARLAAGPEADWARVGAAADVAAVVAVPELLAGQTAGFLWTTPLAFSSAAAEVAPIAADSVLFSPSDDDISWPIRK